MRRLENPGHLRRLLNLPSRERLHMTEEVRLIGYNADARRGPKLLKVVAALLVRRTDMAVAAIWRS